MDSVASIASSLGKKLLVFVIWTVISLVISYVLSAADGGGAAMLFGGGASQYEAAMEACIVRPASIDVTLRDVGGLQGVKEEIYYSLLLPLRYPKIFFRPRGPFATSKGFLLVGPPGCGKTMLARAIAKTCNCCFLSPSMADLQSKYYGESQKLLRAMFSVARKNAPCVIFIDEADSAFRTRSDDDSGCDHTLKTEFLSLFDGLRTAKDEAIVVIAATNNPKSLDPAFKRRLPNVLNIDLPTAQEQRHIVSLLCHDEPKAVAAESEQSFLTLVEGENAEGLTRGFSGSDLAEMYKISSRMRLRSVLTQSPDTLLLHGGDESIVHPISSAQWAEAIAQIQTSKKNASTGHCMSPRSRVSDVLNALREARPEDSTTK